MRARVCVSACAYLLLPALLVLAAPVLAEEPPPWEAPLTKAGWEGQEGKRYRVAGRLGVLSGEGTLVVIITGLGHSPRCRADGEDARKLWAARQEARNKGEAINDYGVWVELEGTAKNRGFVDVSVKSIEIVTSKEARTRIGKQRKARDNKQKTEAKKKK